MSRDEDYMKVALMIAENALPKKLIPVGAVFVQGESVIGVGGKTGKEHSRLDHAERNGCTSILNKNSGVASLEGVTVYTTLEPCHMCMGILLGLRISRIVYAFPDPYGGAGHVLRDPALPSRYQSQRPDIVGDVLRSGSARLLASFFRGQQDGEFWSGKDNPLVQLALNEG